MDIFTASNGVEVKRRRNEVVFSGGMYIEAPEELAAREFFQAERDEKLGRWRWPENPDYMVYARGDGWLVLSERSGNSKHYSHRDHASVGNSELTQAMRAYFEAHPEPKPWHDAKHGEIWVITVKGWIVLPEPYRVIDGKLRPVSNPDRFWVAPDSPEITAGRRIWPESD